MSANSFHCDFFQICFVQNFFDNLFYFVILPCNIDENKKMNRNICKNFKWDVIQMKFSICIYSWWWWFCLLWQWLIILWFIFAAAFVFDWFYCCSSTFYALWCSFAVVCIIFCRCFTFWWFLWTHFLLALNIWAISYKILTSLCSLSGSDTSSSDSESFGFFPRPGLPRVFVFVAVVFFRFGSSL